MSVAVGARVHWLAGAACVVLMSLYMSDGFWKPNLLRGPYINFWLYDVAAWLLLPTLLLAALHNATSLSPEDYGLSADLGWKDLAYVLPLPLFALFSVNVVASAVANGVLGYPEAPFSYITALKALGSLWIVGTIYLAATAGFWESIVWIGLPWFALSRTLSTSVTARRLFTIISATLFAVAHFENGLPNAIGAFFFQLVAATWYFRLRTLWPIVAAHALVDVYYFWPWPWYKT